MSIVKNKDRRTGVTYVYESESYWDKDKKQPRAHRKLIEKIDEATGNIVPTDGRGRRRKDAEPSAAGVKDPASPEKDAVIKEQAARIAELEAEVRALKSEKAAVLKDISAIASRLSR